VAMEFVLCGWGFRIHPAFCGGAPGVPISWSWCLTLYWKSPSHGGNEEAESFNWWWRSRCLYGRWHDDVAIQMRMFEETP